MRKPLLVLVHGILTGQTGPGWVDRFEQWLWQRGGAFETIKRKYRAGPFPLWNVWVKNAWHAWALANELRPFLQDGAELNFVAHSNGADIVRQTLRRLAKEGYATKTVIFLAGAVQADVRKNGILPLMEAGKLHRALAYCSKEDRVLRWRATWPSGHLGRVGWRLDTEAAELHQLGLVDLPYDGREVLSARRRGMPLIGTRWFAGGHSSYFAPKNELETFRLLLGDLTPTA